MAVSSFNFALENIIQLAPPAASSSPAVRSSPSLLKVFDRGPSNGFRKMTLIQRLSAPVMIPRCAVAPDLAMASIDAARSSSLSALEQLKTSAVDRYTKERSSIIVIGLNVHTCPVEMCEKLAIPEAEWPRAIEELCNLNHIEEAAVLSTSDRMEIYMVALSQHRGVKEVTEWMSKTSGVPISEICQHRFLLYNSDATNHLFEVSAGLDTLILGEGQMLGQVMQVVKVGQGVVGFGRNVSGLFKHAITIAKQVRAETNIAARTVSVSSAAVELALMKLPEASHATARMLVIGAGKMGKLVMEHLVAKGYTKVVVVDRSEERVAAMLEESKDAEIIYKPLTEMLACAAEADVVFISIASESPLFFKENVQNLPSVSQEVGGVRLFVDISVPRNVGSCVSDLDNTRVYNVDDLKEVVAAKEGHLRKAMEAQAIIADESKQFGAWRDSLETVPTMIKLREFAERIIAEELEKCLSKLGDDLPEKTRIAVNDLSRSIMNQFLHAPMQHLRCNGSNNWTLSETLENMHAVTRMFGLEKEVFVFKEKFRTKVKQILK